LCSFKRKKKKKKIESGSAFVSKFLKQERYIFVFIFFHHKEKKIEKIEQREPSFFWSLKD